MDTIDKINKLLNENGMTGAELSRRIGVSNSVYSQWNKRRTTPKMSNLTRISEVFGVKVADLLPDKETDGETVKPESSSVSEDDIKYALFGDADVTDELFEEVKRYAKYAQEQERFRKFKKGE